MVDVGILAPRSFFTDYQVARCPDRYNSPLDTREKRSPQDQTFLGWVCEAEPDNDDQ